MTNRRQKKRKNRWMARAVGLILVVIAVMVCYLVWDAYFKVEPAKDSMGEIKFVPVQDVGTDEASKEEPERAEQDDGSRVELEPQEVMQYEGEDPNELDTLTGAVTFAGVNDRELVVRVNLDQYLDSGRCELVLMRDGANLKTVTTEVMGVVSTATCDGFDIALDELGHGWTEIVIKVTAGGKVGTIYGGVEL